MFNIVKYYFRLRLFKTKDYNILYICIYRFRFKVNKRERQKYFCCVSTFSAEFLNTRALT